MALRWRGLAVGACSGWKVGTFCLDLILTVFRFALVFLAAVNFFLRAFCFAGWGDRAVRYPMHIQRSEGSFEI